MSKPTSLPVVPAQPDLPQYGVGSLALFKTFTRDSYLAAFGVQAPPFDPTKKPKHWFDTSVTGAPDDVVSYLRCMGVDQAGNPKPFKNFGITVADAETVNLPGAFNYPAYNPAPTQATAGGSLLNNRYLCLKEEADELCVEINAAMPPTKQYEVYEAALGGPFAYYYPPNEPRRVYQIGPLNAGLLLSAKNQQGVGKPGKWVLENPNGEEPVWKWDPVPATSNNLAAVEMPLRELLPNEKLVANLFAGVVIQRIDKQPPSPAAGGFTQQDRDMLVDIHDNIHKILKLLVT